MKAFSRLSAVIFLLICLISADLRPAAAQQPDPRTFALELIQRMTTREKVGQIFLVGFNGTDLRDTSAIYHLINDYRIGGVVLSRDADNFPGGDDQAAAIRQRNAALQQIANQAGVTQPGGGYVPLFIAVSQPGDGYPNDEILSGLTPQPSLMALGATWDPQLARSSAQVLGKELSDLGFNLLLGPSLNVMDGWYSQGSETLGTGTFGGNAYWVSRLGQAYIAGLHEGSADSSGRSRLLVAARNFPGQGSADRNPQREIPTINKTLEQLRSNELIPFAFSSLNLADSASVSDALLVANARYQGFQGLISEQTTRPLSLDQAALAEVFKLDPFTIWRNGGGLLISDNLGSPAMRSFLDPKNNSFDVRQVARSAFLAGNDVLFLDRVVSSADRESFASLTTTLEYFAQIYESDNAFAQRVDAALLRILLAKQKTAPDWTLSAVIPPESGLAEVGNNLSQTVEVAAASATLIHPDPISLSNILPRPPGPSDRITILVDDVRYRQCSSCDEVASLPVDALQNSILRLYTSPTGGQVSRSLLESYTLTDLNRIFVTQEEKEPVEESIQLANWLVVLLQRRTTERPESAAFSRLLSERPDLIRNKRIIVFALDAPYYMDATDISKISAYYALYAKSAPFIDLAARILFQEHIPNGSLPVTLPGVGISLDQQLKPNPTQIIALSLDVAEEESQNGPPQATSTAVPIYKVGDILRLRTSVIVDHNQRPVPDGTPVRFSFALGNEPGLAQTVETLTQNGIARVSYKIERGERLEVTAASEPALNSTHLILDITGGGAVITIIAPTAQPTQTLSPTQVVTATPPPVTPTPAPVRPTATGIRDWVTAMLAAILVTLLVGWLSSHIFSPRWSYRMALSTLLGSLIATTWLAFGFPGTAELIAARQTSGVLIVSLAGALAGASAGRIWHWIIVRSFRGNPPTNTPSKPEGQASSK